MISFFRRALSSWLVLGLLGLIMVAFIVTGVGTPSGLGSLGGGASSDTVATIGQASLTGHEVTTRTQLGLEAARQEQPTLDMGTFVKGGGFDEVLKQMIAARALEIWAKQHGFAASNRLIDGDIASINAFNGPTGQFDRKIFESVLAQRHITESQLRADIAGDAIRRQMLVPIAGAAAIPTNLVSPYASLLLESRSGSVGIVPAELMPAGTPPTDAEVKAYYTANIARYSLPERRVLRYALFGKDQLPAVAAPTDAEVSAYYQGHAADFAASETRTLSQIIVPAQKAAAAIVAKIKSGTPFAAAALTAGFSPKDSALGEKSRAQFTDLTSPAVAAAAFAAPQGGTTDAIKSELGWHVVHVDAIKSIGGKTLAQAKGDIVAALTKKKQDEAVANMVNAIEDAVDNGSSFDEIVKSEKLTVLTTPPLTAQGAAPTTPGFQPSAEVQELLKPAFDAEANDKPTVETLAKGGAHALLKVETIVPAAPVPLPQAILQVKADLLVNRAADRAKAVATTIMAKANAGTSLADAITASGLKLPPPQKISARQIDLMQSGRQVPPPLAMLFGLAPGKTKLFPAPQSKGWFVVHLDSVQKGDIATMPSLIDATRGQFMRMVGQEYIEQFAEAARREVGVKRNDAAIARVRQELAGGGASNQ